MKKKLIFVYILLFAFFLLCGCGEEKEIIIDDPQFEIEDIVVLMGDIYEIKPATNIPNAKFNYALEGECATLYENTIIPNEVGTATLIVSVEGYELIKTFEVQCVEEGIVITGSHTVGINQETDLNLLFFGVEESDEITWKSSNNTIGRVSKGKVTGVALGEITITAKYDNYMATFNIEVIRPIATEIIVEKNKEEVIYELGANYVMSVEVTPKLALQDYTVEASNDCVIVNDDLSIKANKLGDVILTVTSLSDQNIKKEVKVKIMNNEAPTFIKQTDYKENLTINWGSTLSCTAGLRVVDNSDGDITSTVVAESLDDLQKFGTHEITLVATDRAGNKATFKRTVTVEWQYKTKFIGHQGCFYAVPNTEEAFRYAGEVLHYQAVECDLKSTKDGVLVVCHDGDFGGVDIATTNYNDLLKAVETSTQFGCPANYYGKKTYTGHICTFDTYLDVCLEYNMIPIIELKGAYGMNSGNTSQIPTLMKILRDKGIYDRAVILTSMDPVISYIRKQGETVKCQYLVNGASSDDVLNFCIANNCDVSVNVTYGNSITDAYIKKYHDAGLEVSTWTFTSYCDYAQVQEWINKGVDYVTCDWHYIDQGKLILK